MNILDFIMFIYRSKLEHLERCSAATNSLMGSSVVRGLGALKPKGRGLWCVWHSPSLPVNSLRPVHTLVKARPGLEPLCGADELDLACLTRFNIPRHGRAARASNTEGNVFNCFLLGDEF